MDKKYVWVLGTKDSDGYSISGIYRSEKSARRALGEYMQSGENGWEDDDFYGRSCEECLEATSYTYNGAESCTYVQEQEVLP